MKVLIIQAGFGAGGAEKIVAMIAAHRASLGDEVHVAAATEPADGSYFDYPENVTRHVIDQPGKASGQFSQIQRIAALRRLIRRQRPDVILSFLTKVNVQTLLAAFGTGVPVIVSERNNVRAQSAHPIWRHAQTFLMPRAAQIVMQTKRACAHVPVRARAKVHVIPNPCAAKHIVKTTYSDRSPRLSAVGRLSYQKGFDILLEAMATINQRTPNLRLTVYGEGNERVELETRRHHLGLDNAVAFPGNSYPPGSWVTETDILLLTSRYEGFPNVVAEALVNGIPVIAFDCDFGPRELIEDNVNGFLIRVGDVEGFAQAVECLVASPALRRAMGRNADIMRERLDPARIMASWDAVISDAVMHATDESTDGLALEAQPQSGR